MQSIKLLRLVLFCLCVGASVSTGGEDDTDRLYARYFFSAEAVYTEIVVDQEQLSVKYFLDSEGRCAQSIVSAPCWTEKDLKSIQAELTAKELEKMDEFLSSSGFMNLQNEKKDETRRSYPEVIEVRLRDRELSYTYHSYPDAPERPEAFVRVKAMLLELVGNKVNLRF